jgi:Tol biopolymer transport system component
LLALLLIVAAPRAAQPAIPRLLTANGAQDSLVLLDLTTGQAQTITLATGVHTPWGFSPDGCRLLATVMQPNGLARAFTARLDGSDIQPLVTLPDLPDSRWGVWEPAWAPTGDKIAFTLLRDDLPDAPGRSYHIAWVPATGGQPTFYSQTGREHTPVWSPDGARLAYVSYDLRAAGATPDATAEPDIATNTPPDQRIAEADLWVVNADGTGKYRATAFPTGSVRAPRWSPSGERLAFLYAPSPSNDTVWVMPAQPDAPATQITYHYHLALDLTWLPDENGLLAALRGYNDLETAALWRLPLAAGADAQATLYQTPESVPHPDYPAFDATGGLALRTAYHVGWLSPEGALITHPDGLGNMPVYPAPQSYEDSNICS